MLLELENGETVEDPDPDAVAEAVRGLQFPGDKFAILDNGEGGFMQAYLLEDGDFTVEFQEGSLTRHYRAPFAASVEEVVDAFRSYVVGDNVWRTAFEWKKLWLRESLPDRVLAVTDATYADEVLTSDLPVLLAFQADGDVTSAALDPILAEVARERAGRLIVATVEVGANPAVAGQWGIHRVPTMVVLRAGVLQRVLLGIRPAARLLRDLDEATR